ncbi:hypothetical protein F53441_10599 [Fusarium austroafricanum]|uniref:Uncharacterized protein n=1 Tax=Fusarium austroafricanum TaxID=2364996 RepID=A0A8H4KAE0_9HYPO|nr:hypothetical protein F53441_10599 [Fusarium austroafricanum]
MIEYAISSAAGIDYIKITGEAEDALSDERPKDEESFWDTFSHVVNIALSVIGKLTSSKTEDVIDPSVQPFVEGLLQSAKSGKKHEEEEFFDFLSGIANTSTKIVFAAAPVLDGVTSIAGALGGGTEDSFEPDSDDLTPHDIEQEGFFIDLVNTVKTMGTIVIRAAPTVIKAVTPSI